MYLKIKLYLLKIFYPQRYILYNQSLSNGWNKEQSYNIAINIHDYNIIWKFIPKQIRKEKLKKLNNYVE
jgi:hypothetical protein